MPHTKRGNKRMRVLLLMIMIAGCLLLPGCWETTQKETLAQIVPSASLNLDEVLHGQSGADRLRELISEGNVIVDFYATWCPPCKMMLPIINDIANEYPQIKVIKVDIDKFKDIAEGLQVGDDKISIGSVPQFYFFKDGELKDYFKGGKEKDAIKQIINNIFNL